MERWVGIGLGLNSFSLALYYFSFVKEYDPTQLIFGVMDPPIAYTLASLGIGLTGGILGMAVGRSLWNYNKR